MTKARRTTAERRALLAALALRPGLTADQLARQTKLTPDVVLDTLLAMAQAGSAHSNRQRLSPTGPRVIAWYPGRA